MLYLIINNLWMDITQLVDDEAEEMDRMNWPR
jgi:hypothetical protein